MIEEIDIDKSSGEMSASVDELLHWNIKNIVVSRVQKTYLIRTKSCIMN